MTTPHQLKVATIAMVIALVTAVWFLWPQLFVVAFSALLAWVFYPMFLLFKRKRVPIAAVATMLVTILVALIPLTFLVIAAVTQLKAIGEAAGNLGTGQVPPFVTSLVETINSVMSSLTGVQPTVTVDGVVEFLRNAVPAIAHSASQILLGALGNLPALVVASIIYMFTFVEFLLYGPKIIKKIESVSPFDKDVTRRYFERIGMMSNAMIKGQLFISMILSAIAAVLLIPLGYGPYIFALFIIFTILNYIPLGCGILMVPLCLWSMLTGQATTGLVVLILYFLSGNLDAPLRAHFIPKKIQLSIGLTLVSTFCGIAWFGFLGVVYGPVIMIVLLTTLDLYANVRVAK